MLAAQLIACALLAKSHDGTARGSPIQQEDNSLTSFALATTPTSIDGVVHPRASACIAGREVATFYLLGMQKCATTSLAALLIDAGLQVAGVRIGQSDGRAQGGGWGPSEEAVSYTHLTLPTICSV